MFLLEAVETHRHRAQAGIHQAAQPRVVEGHAVGHHTPRIAPAGHFGPRDLQIGPHEHLASRKDKQHAAGIDMGRDLLVQHPQEILQRHILHPRIDTAVAAAMTAGQITAKRTLPEECTQPVLPHLVGIQIGKQTQSDPFAQTGTAACHPNAPPSAVREAPRRRGQRPGGANPDDGLLLRNRRTDAIHQPDLGNVLHRIRPLRCRILVAGGITHRRTGRGESEHGQQRPLDFFTHSCQSIFYTRSNKKGSGQR